MTIAITGASGYLGQVLTPLLAAGGHSLRLLVRSPLPADIPSTQLISGDLLCRESLEALVQGAEAVIHMGAVISIQDKPDAHALAVNVDGTRYLLEASLNAGVRRFIQVSSVAAFNQAPIDQPMREDRRTAASEQHTYDYSKSISQQMALSYNQRGMEVIALAPSALFGPFDTKPSLIGKAIISMCKGRVPALLPGGVDFVDVRDVAAAIVASLERGEPGSVYLLSGKWVSLEDFAKEVGIARGKKLSLPVLPLWLICGSLPFVKALGSLTGAPPYYTRQAIRNLVCSNRKIDSSRARAELQFEPRPFQETLKDTIAWFRQTGMLPS